MVNKQGLWFLTLTSLALVLSVYYITMPNEILMNEKSSITSKKDTSNNKKKSKRRIFFFMKKIWALFL